MSQTPSSAFDITKFVSFSSTSTRSSANFKLYHSKPSTNNCRHFYFNRLPRLWNSLPVFLSIYHSPSSSNSRMFYGQNSNLTSMLAIHALFIICAHVETAQCHSLLHIILLRLLVSSNKSFRITIFLAYNYICFF